MGAVFSPITAKMEPIDIGTRNENLFDCYTVSRLNVVPSTSRTQKSHIQRKINWVTLNTFGEAQLSGCGVGYKDEDVNSYLLPKIDSFDFGSSDVMEEDVMEMEPGLVFFEVVPIIVFCALCKSSKFYLLVANMRLGYFLDRTNKSVDQKLKENIWFKVL